MKYSIHIYLFLLAAVILNSCITAGNLTIDGYLASEDTRSQPTPTDTVQIEEGVAVKPMPSVDDRNHLRIQNHYACVDSTLEITYRASNLIVDIDTTIGQCFGVWFETQDVTKTPQIEVFAKYTGPDTLSILAGFTDSNSNTHYATDKAQSLTNDGFKKLVFNYGDPLTNGINEVDMTLAKSVLFFYNIEESKSVKGQLLIKSIEINSNKQ